MKLTKEAVPASGLTVLFEPDEARNAVIDILFVSGPGGHPVRTWQHTTNSTSESPGSQDTPKGGTGDGLPRRRGSLRELVRKNSNSLKRCLSNASLSREGSLRKKAEERERDRRDREKLKDEDVQPPLPMTLPTPRQRRVLRKNNYARKSDYPNYPTTTRSESKLLLLAGAVAHSTVTTAAARTAAATVDESRLRRTKSTSRLRLGRTLVDDTSQTRQQQPPADDPSHPSVYWPLDLLPASCPNTRIITWGCQTLSTKGRLLPAQNNIFDHAADLLRELAAFRRDSRTAGRSLVVVAHGLGGIVVKELLCRAEASDEPAQKDVLQSLAGVVFFGSPHRESQYGTLHDAVKHLAGQALGVSSHDEVLQDLCGVIDNTRSRQTSVLEMGRQAFVRLWNDYNFRVKTFQEADRSHNSAISQSEQQNTLRREAASFGDPRERCEPVEASHADLARFSSAENPVYRSLSFYLLRFVHDEIHRLRDLTPKEEEVLRALASQPTTTLPQSVSSAATARVESYPGTGLWLYDLPEFRAWHQRSSGGRNRILWIKGRPGSGKSVLLKSLRGRVERQWGPLNSNFVWSLAEGDTVNSVFFPGKHRPHQQYATSPAGVYRSLLAQLYFQDPRLRKALASVCQRTSTGSGTSISFDDAQVVTFFVDDYVDQKIETPTRRTFIFVDATDDCGISYLQDMLYYLSQLAANSDYSICVATTAHPEIVLDNAIEVVMHQQNIDDILRYVSLNLIAEWADRHSTVVRIGQKAGGCFLWAEIVVSILNAAIEEGATEDLVEEAVAEMPGDIDGLYEWLFSTLGPDEKAETLLLMQWVLFAPEPLRLDDLRTAIQLSKQSHQGPSPLHIGPPTSLHGLSRTGDSAFDGPVQFYSWVRSRSIGLLELLPQSPVPMHARAHTHTHSHSHSRSGSGSSGGGGGGGQRTASRGTMYEQQNQGLRRVRFIHESVRNFFLHGRGFVCLTNSTTSPTTSPGLSPDLYDSPRPSFDFFEDDLQSENQTADDLAADFADRAHYSMLQACLTCLDAFEVSGVSKRQLDVASHPFSLLSYAVDNWVFHLLSPRLYRYHLPQTDLLRVLSANQCRLWRRWTALLGCSATNADAVMAKCATGSAQELLDPVFGTRYRLERVFKSLAKMSVSHIPVPSLAAPKKTATPGRVRPSGLPRLKTHPPVSSNRFTTRLPPPPRAPPRAPPPPPPPPPLSARSFASQATMADSILFSPQSRDSPSSPNTPLSYLSPTSLGPERGADSFWSPIYVK
ncbi:hypothetical protein HMPREF1624_03996 [Sporothrix schenckii ATCC 58251]|uniref:Nephrocystin 3-like N-terminal domain-containing protein n=1 Tax=Sporothrix schenckii (strain ATCC 58251 / de Perez 2211183) TaxID=1391915 RepID=U7PV26_SPOS1|nr:hypothetical protein HMPREF1624_03996 [Sporothrix schenckii ATCC 58251]